MNTLWILTEKRESFARRHLWGLWPRRQSGRGSPESHGGKCGERSGSTVDEAPGPLCSGGAGLESGEEPEGAEQQNRRQQENQSGSQQVFHSWRNVAPMPGKAASKIVSRTLTRTPPPLSPPSQSSLPSLSLKPSSLNHQRAAAPPTLSEGSRFRRKRRGGVLHVLLIEVQWFSMRPNC